MTDGARTVLLGAGGYLGRVTAQALLERGLSPVLAGRDGDELADLAAGLGGLDLQVADATDPASLTALIDPGDVVISTIAPFRAAGEAVVRAAVSRRAHYLDAAVEPPFIQLVFQKWGRLARQAGVVVMPAVGFSFSPGTIAGAAALQEAGPQATRVQVGYFVLGDFGPSSFSAGVLDSVTGALFEPGLVRRGGVVESAQAAGGETLARVTLTGPNPYALTARLLAHHASAIPNREPTVAGAVGPVSAFGLTTAIEMARQAGLERID